MLKTKPVKSALSLLIALTVIFSVLSIAFPVFAQTKGWVKEDGKWKYCYLDNHDDAFVTGSFWRIDDDWYYFDNNAYMVTGWKKVNGNWYYFASNGKMQTGWIEVKGKTYFISSNSDGSPYHGGGIMQTGWQYIDGVWYYFNSKGALQPDNEISGKWKKNGSRWQFIHSDGSYTKKGWEKINNKWYIFDESGFMLTGWHKFNKKWYYFTPSGSMALGWKKIDGEWYYFGNSGVMQTGWLKDGEDVYFLNPGGSMRKGWLKTNKQIPIDFFGFAYDTDSSFWYYFDKSGRMVDEWQTIGGKTYYFYFGRMLTGFQWLPTWWKSNGHDTQAYFFDPDGSMVTNAWRKRVLENQNYEKWFYFGPDGKALLNQFVGKYFVDANGEWDEEFEPLKITKKVVSVTIGGYEYVLNEEKDDYDRNEIELKTVESSEKIKEITNYINSLELKKVNYIGIGMEGIKYNIKLTYEDETEESFFISCNEGMLSKKAAFYDIDPDYISSFYDSI